MIRSGILEGARISWRGQGPLQGSIGTGILLEKGLGYYKIFIERNQTLKETITNLGVKK